MIDAAEDAIVFLGSTTKESLKTERMLTYALVKALEIVGEGANLVSSEIKSKFPDIPWKEMIDMRNFLVHEYFDINKSTQKRSVK